MGACAGCGDKPNYFSTINEFWKSLHIRTLHAKDWEPLVQLNVDSKQSKKIIPSHWEKIVHKNLYHKDNKELSSKFFHKAMELSESKGGQYYLVLSILFLCISEKDGKHNIRDIFVVCAKDCFYLKKEFKFEDGINYVNKEFLYNIILFYINMISKLSVEILSETASSKSDFEQSFGRMFDEEIQRTFLDEEIFKNQHKEFIDFDVFFNYNYSMIINNILLREKLAIWYENFLLKSKI
jgi:hypothetical protein